MYNMPSGRLHDTALCCGLPYIKTGGLYMKHVKLLAILLIVAMVFSVSAMAIDAPKAGDDLSGKVVIIHTNDTHGGDLAVAGKSIGTAGVTQLRRDYEAAGAEVILVSAGDAVQGAPLVNLSMGEAAINFMSLAGYDLMVPGNHEFDWGTENLLALQKLAKFNIMSANIYDAAKNEPLFDTCATFETKLGKIGMFGLTTPETATKSHPDKVKGTAFHAGEELYADAQAQVDALKKDGCKYIIAVTHLGIDEGSAPNRSIDVAQNVTGIDLMIDGHSHSVLDGSDPANKYGSTLIVSTGEKIANVGVIILDKDNYKAGLIPAANYSKTEASVAAEIKTVNDSVDAQLSKSFAKTEILLDGNRDPGVRTKETNLGDFAADAILWGANFALGEGKVDAAITNGGGIRASIAKGDVTMKDMATVFPYSNTIATVSVTGAQLLEILESAVYSTPQASGSFPQVSGISFTIKTAVPYVNGAKYSDSTYFAPANPGSRVVDVMVAGKPLDLAKTYTIATNDFTASGGDTYYVFKSCKVYNTGVALEDALVTYTSNVLKGVITEAKYGKSAGRIVLDPCPVDVAKDAWYYAQTIKMIESGLMTGVGGGIFAPDGSVSRAMVVTTLHRLAGSPEPTKDAGFADVKADAWYANAVNWAAENKIVEGMGDASGKQIFAPDTNVTREQLATMVYRFEQHKGGGFKGDWAFLLDYVDKQNISQWAYEGVCWMSMNKVIQGLSVEGGMGFVPAGTATRAQLATIFTNYMALAA